MSNKNKKKNNKNNKKNNDDNINNNNNNVNNDNKNNDNVNNKNNNNVNNKNNDNLNNKNNDNLNNKNNDNLNNNDNNNDLNNNDDNNDLNNNNDDNDLNNNDDNDLNNNNVNKNNLKIDIFIDDDIDYYDDFYNEEDNEQDNEKNKDDYENKENDEKDDDLKNNDDENKFFTSLIFFLNPNRDLDNKENKNDDPFDKLNNDIFDNNNNKRHNKRRFQNNNSPILKIKKTKTLTPEEEFKSYFKEADVLIPINKEIKTIKDLIDLGKTYNPEDKNRYVINLRALHKCIKPLEELDAMIGMKNIKEMIVDLIFFRLQNINDESDDMWHLVIQGSPGCGKTEIAKILAKIYYGLCIVKNEKITFAKRSDLIGKYLGHTAKMTQEVFDKAKGGVLFIDEAYSLGNPEGRDSFSKECIDTINQNLTENRDTVVFIAGYKEQLNESFFSYNPGLNRRFKMRLTVDKYNATDLRDIFLKKIRENKWFILNDNEEKEISKSFFEKNINMFKYNGGDMENLWHLTKIVHSRRIFGKSNDLVKRITLTDLENGFKLYCDNDEVKNRSDDISIYIYNTMYI